MAFSLMLSHISLDIPAEFCLCKSGVLANKFGRNIIQVCLVSEHILYPKEWYTIYVILPITLL